MRTTTLLAALLLLGCGHDPSASSTPTTTSTTTSTSTATSPPLAATQPAATSSANVAPSACAFATLEALCAGFREHYRSSGTGWVSEECAYGERRSSSGAFAEVVVVGAHVGYETPTPGAHVERALLGGVVHGPAGTDAPATQLMLAGRVGTRWFPLWLYGGGDRGPSVAWTLDPDGAFVRMTKTDGPPAEAQPDHRAIERVVFGTRDGVPLIVASATVERVHTEHDVACMRACNTPSRRPAAPGCTDRCTSRTRMSRSWAEHEGRIEIGASVTTIERDGRVMTQDDVVAPAETRSLESAEAWLAVCGFTPIVRAVVRTTPPTDDVSLEALVRARARLANGRFVDLAGASGAALANAPRSVIEVYETSGSACGGGGCTTGIRTRTIDGSMPEEGVNYFTYERGPTTGCHPAAMPRLGASTFLEVAPARPDASVGCGFSGFDGTSRLTWVVLRVFVHAP